MTKKPPDRVMWGARKLQRDIESELKTIHGLLDALRKNSTDPHTVEDIANLLKISVQNISLQMERDYENVTRLGNQAHEGRLAALEQMFAEHQRDMEEFRTRLDKLSADYFRRGRETG
jgi:tryptophanyl-tRNA synthetase